MNYNEFVNKSDEEKTEILSNLNDAQIISLVRGILDNNNGDLFKFIYDDTDNVSTELLRNCLDDYGVFNDRSGNKLKKVYNLLSSNDGDDRQAEFVNGCEFGILVVLLNSLNDSEKNIVFNKLEFEKLNEFYESYGSEEKIKFLNRLDAEHKSNLLFGVVNPNNGNAVSQEVIDKQIEIFRGIINKKSKRESVSELSDVMGCLERTGNSNKIHFALNLDLKEIKLLCKSLPNSVFNGLEEEEKENFINTFDDKINSYNRSRSKSRKEKAKWLNKIKNKCLGIGIISKISDRILKNNVDDEEEIENNRNGSRRSRRHNQNDNNNNNSQTNEPKIQVDYFTTSPMHVDMTISEIRNIIANGTKTVYRYKGKIITDGLLNEIQESFTNEHATENAEEQEQQENANEHASENVGEQDQQENPNERDSENAEEQEQQENTNEHASENVGEQDQQENPNERDSENVEEQEQQENTNEHATENAEEQEQQENANKHATENTEEQDQQENPNERDSENAEEQEQQENTNEQENEDRHQRNVSSTSEKGLVDVVKCISNVVESIEALEALNFDLTDTKNIFEDAIFNKIGDFFEIDTLSDKQLKVMKIILDEVRDKIDKKQSGHTR